MPDTSGWTLVHVTQPVGDHVHIMEDETAVVVSLAGLQKANI